jgi:FKBP-type peptidyl-prolyl cis-trans isomerase (trigger factor)
MLHFEMQVEGGITMDLSWQELYRAALLEVQPEQLRQRIDAAEKAIFERSEELRQAGNQGNKEQAAMADALRALRVLAQSECQAGHLRLPEVELAKGRVTS